MTEISLCRNIETTPEKDKQRLEITMLSRQYVAYCCCTYALTTIILAFSCVGNVTYLKNFLSLLGLTEQLDTNI